MNKDSYGRDHQFRSFGDTIISMDNYYQMLDEIYEHIDYGMSYVWEVLSKYNIDEVYSDELIRATIKLHN